jgi:hypothetical protein
MPQKKDISDRIILSFSEVDHLQLATMYEGTFVSGAPGSGKSSAVGKQIAYGLLATPNSGGLILTAKASETQAWIDYAQACGRSQDVIVFNEKSGLVFDPIAYEWNRPGRGAGDIENVIDFFSTLVSLGKKEVGQGHDPFGKGATSHSCAM